MNYADVYEYGRWGLAAIVIPVWKWVDKRRKNYESLQTTVKVMQTEIKDLSDTVNQDREDRMKRIEEDNRYRDKQNDKLDKIHDMLSDLHAKTEVNSALLNIKNNQQ